MNILIGLIFSVLSMITVLPNQSICVDDPGEALCQTLFVNCTATAAHSFVQGEITHGVYMDFTYNLCPNAYNDCMSDLQVA